MRVLVTGATGFVGLHCARALLNAGHEVCLSVRSAEKMRRLLARFGLPEQLIAVGDITDGARLREAMAGCDGLIHAAALVSLDPGAAATMRQTNVMGTRAVMAAAQDSGIQSIVYVSSAAALFDSSLAKIDESSPLAPAQSAYAKSKVEADAHVRQLIEAGAPIAITYPTGVVGPDDPALSEGNKSLQILLRYCHIHTSSGLQMIDVRDLAQVQVQLLEDKLSGQFLVAGDFISYRDLGELLEQVTGRRLLKIPVPGPLLRGLGRSLDAVSRFRPLQTPLTLEAMNFATRWVACDDRKLRDTLNHVHRPLSVTLNDTIRSLAKSDYIQKKWLDRLKD